MIHQIQTYFSYFRIIFLNSERCCNYTGIDEEYRELERYFYSLLSAGLAKAWKKTKHMTTNDD